VTAFLEATTVGAQSLSEALRTWFKDRFGASLPTDAFDRADLPLHLLANVRVVDASGTELASGRDLAALRHELGQAAQMTFAAAGPSIERKGLTRWDFGHLPATLAVTRGGAQLTGYPALVDEHDSVALLLMDTESAALAATRAGIVRLIRIALKDALSRWRRTRRDSRSRRCSSGRRSPPTCSAPT